MNGGFNESGKCKISGCCTISPPKAKYFCHQDSSMSTILDTFKYINITHC